MILNVHLAELVARDRMREALAHAKWQLLVRSDRPPRLPIRVALGLALIRAGHWLADRSAGAGPEPGRARVTA